MKIKMNYETKGKARTVEFVPTSLLITGWDSTGSAIWNFGVPARIEKIMDSKSFRLIEFVEIQEVVQ